MHDHDDPNNPLGSTRQTPEGVPIIDGPDGLAELDNPMPRWMTNVFWLTILWSVGYIVLYPGIGLSVLGWTQKGMYDAEMAEAKARYQGAAPAAGGGDTLAAALKDPEAAKRGEATFQAQCAACHGQGGKGAIGQIGRASCRERV